MNKLLISLLFISTNCFAWTVEISKVTPKGAVSDDYTYKIPSSKNSTLRPFPDFGCETHAGERQLIFLYCQIKGQLTTGTNVSPRQGWSTLVYFLGNDPMEKYVVMIIHE